MPSTSRLADRLARRRAERPAGGISGVGRVLVAAYAILAIAATGRSAVQILGHFDRAPLAYSLSALAALVYGAATIALVAGGDRGRRVAWIAIVIELAGVIAVGMASGLDPALFPADAVWSGFGRGYGYVPAVLPILGIAWLESGLRPAPAARADRAPAAPA